MRQGIWIAALIAGASFMWPVLSGWFGPEMVLWKGAGVALLALWAATHARTLDGWLLVAVMAFGAAGDMLIELAGLEVGALAFALGHMVAIALYARNRRPAVSTSQAVLAWVAVPAAIAITWALLAPQAGWIGAVIYALFVAVMAAMAWTSRFPRYRTGIGAMMFLASDLFIFARAGGALSPAFTVWLIWPLYFAGQALIAAGVVRTLGAERS